MTKQSYTDTNFNCKLQRNGVDVSTDTISVLSTAESPTTLQFVRINGVDYKVISEIEISGGTAETGKAITALSANNNTITVTKGSFLTEHQTVTNHSATLSWGSAVNIAKIGNTQITATLPANPNTDTLVKQTSVSDNTAYKIMLSNTTSGTAAEAYFPTDVTLNPNTKAISASDYSISAKTGTLSGALTVGGGEALTGLLKITPTARNYREGIRISRMNSWSTIMLGTAGTSDTGMDSGWGIFRSNEGKFIVSGISSAYSTALFHGIYNTTTAKHTFTIPHILSVGGDSSFTGTSTFSGAIKEYGGTVRINITNTTTATAAPFDLNNYSCSTGSPTCYKLIENIIGGESTYTGAYGVANRPSGMNCPFIVDVDLVRFAGSTDFTVRQICWATGATTSYIRWGTGGSSGVTWGDWTTQYYTDTNNRVTENYANGNYTYPILFSSTANITSTGNRGNVYALLNNSIYANPSTGTVFTKCLNVSSTSTLTGAVTATGGLTIKNMTWQPAGNITLNSSADNQEWSFDIHRGDYNTATWHVWDNKVYSMLDVVAYKNSSSVNTSKVTVRNNTEYGTAQVRNVMAGTAEPSGGGNGDIYIQYGGTPHLGTVSIGDTGTPVYFLNGEPVECTVVSTTDKMTSSTASTGTKLYLIGAEQQSSDGQETKSNVGCYIGDDNCLYSNGSKVITSIPITSITVGGQTVGVSNKVAAIYATSGTAYSSSNPLATQAFVNSSISTSTATYRGSYHVVDDLELSYDASNADIATKLNSTVTTKDDNDYVFVQIPTSGTSGAKIAEVRRFKYSSSSFAYEYTLNNSGYTEAQWAAINSEINSTTVGKLVLTDSTQTITGAKTFTDAVTVQSTGNPIFKSKILSLPNGSVPSSLVWGGMRFTNAGDVEVGSITYNQTTAGNGYIHLYVKNKSKVASSFQFYKCEDGTAFATFPHRTYSTANTMDVVTIGMINAPMPRRQPIYQISSVNSNTSSPASAIRWNKIAQITTSTKTNSTAILDFTIMGTYWCSNLRASVTISQSAANITGGQLRCMSNYYDSTWCPRVYMVWLTDTTAEVWVNSGRTSTDGSGAPGTANYASLLPGYTVCRGTYNLWDYNFYSQSTEPEWYTEYITSPSSPTSYKHVFTVTSGYTVSAMSEEVKAELKDLRMDITNTSHSQYWNSIKFTDLNSRRIAQISTKIIGAYRVLELYAFKNTGQSSGESNFCMALTHDATNNIGYVTAPFRVYSSAVTTTGASDVLTKAHLESAITIGGAKTFTGAITGKAGITASDGSTGSALLSNGSIELSAATPFIDFHFEKSTADYTSRIIETASGTLTAAANVSIGGYGGNTKTLTVNGTATHTDSITIQKDSGYLIFKASSIPSGQNDDGWLGNIGFRHSDSSTNVGLIDFLNGATYNYIRLKSRRLNSEGTTIREASLNIYAPESENGYVTAANRTYSSAGSSDVLVKGHVGAISELVHTTGAETIAGNKTFTGLTTFSGKVLCTQRITSVKTDNKITSGTSNVWFKVFECDRTSMASWSEWNMVFDVFDGWTAPTLYAKFKVALATNGTKTTDGKAYTLSSTPVMNCYSLSSSVTTHGLLNMLYLYYDQTDDTDHKVQVWIYINSGQTQYSFQMVSATARAANGTTAFTLDNWTATAVGSPTEPEYVTSGTTGKLRIQPSFVNTITGPAVVRNTLSVAGTSTLAGITASGKIIQTYSGVDPIRIEGTYPYFDFRANSINCATGSYSDYVTPRYVFTEKNGYTLGYIGVRNPNASTSEMKLCNYLLNTSGSSLASGTLSLVSVKNTDDTYSSYMTAPYRTYDSQSTNDNEVLVKGHIAGISELVHTVNNETIAGTKTFTSIICRKNNDWDSTTRPSSGSSYTSAIYNYDKNGYIIGWLENFKTTTEQGIRIGARSYDKGSSSPTYQQLALYHQYSDDTWYVSTPGINVTGKATITGPSVVRDTLSVAGATIFSNTLSVAGATTLAGVNYNNSYRKTIGVTKDTLPSSAWWLRSNIDFVRISSDASGTCGTAYANRIYEDRQYLDTSGNIRVDFIAYSFNTSKGTNTLSLYNNYDGTQYATVPSRAYSSAGSSDILTKSHVASITDLVHTTGNETIAGNKTFTGTTSSKGNAAFKAVIGGVSTGGTWYKMASTVMSGSYADTHLSLLIHDNYSYLTNSVERVGILEIHGRMSNSALSVPKCAFSYACQNITPEYFAAVYYSSTKTIELWVKQPNAYSTIVGTRLTDDYYSSSWTLYNNNPASTSDLTTLGGDGIVYASTPNMIGNIANATNATKAAADANGNVISSYYLPLSGGSMTGYLYAKAGTVGSTATAMVRNIIVSSSAPTSGSGSNGDVWLQYDA